MSAETRKTRWGLWVSIALSVVFLVAVFGVSVEHRGSEPQRDYPVGMNSARNLVLLLAERARATGRWPEHSGPAFVLTLVATRAIDPARRDNLRMLWPTGELPEGLDLRRYDTLTEETLRSGDLRGLTGAAGRRNLDPGYSLLGLNHDGTEPILGWRWKDGVVLGYADGSVRFHSRDGLGLAEDDPIVFGEASKSDLLRALSEE